MQENVCDCMQKTTTKNKNKKKKKTQVINQFLMLVMYHIILSIDISFSFFILLVLLHYILGWMGWVFFLSRDIISRK